MAKKHKDKERERKKHRKPRSRSRSRSKERESHKHGHKSSHRSKEKKKVREYLDEADFLLEKSYERKRMKEYYEPEETTIKIKEEQQDYEEEFETFEEGEVETAANDGAVASTSGDKSLSITETNRLRAKLGLKPLEVAQSIPGLEDSADNTEISSIDGKAEVFVKTENISELKAAEKLREKIAVQKEKRKIVERLKKIKGLGESDSEDESASAWISKSRKLQEQKQMAEKRAKLLEEMDEEFRVSALVEEEFNTSKNKNYTSQDLKNLSVGHSQESFKEGHRIILTLKDKGVLEEDEDVLENVNLVDEERAAKNVKNKIRKPDYQPYDDSEFNEEDIDDYGMIKRRKILSKYDEEIEGTKHDSFRIGTSSASIREKELDMIRAKIKQNKAISLEMPALQIASEYYTEDDMVQFKKTKKKKVRKIRKEEVLKADDLLEMAMREQYEDHGSRRQGTSVRKITYLPEDNDDEDLHSEFLPGLSQNKQEDMDIERSDDEEPDKIGPDEDLTGVVVEEEKAEIELVAALQKARKLRHREIFAPAPEKVVEVMHKTTKMKIDKNKAGLGKSAAIVLNSTAEFCRTLGEIPTYGMSGNRDEEADELLDFEKELMEERKRQEQEAQNRGAWNEVDIDEKPVEIKDRENEPILEEEPDVSSGLAGALNLATKKGYLDKEMKKAFNAPRQSQLQAQAYTIEEKFYEDDKFGKRDRYTGPIQDFREKDTYKPDVKLEYIDDSGRLLESKEAFRYLSHKFHGKGPGKNKVDKRMKKLEQEHRLKQMSSTDTPLGTLKLLQEKQKEMQSPYIVLSGGSKTITQTMISKPK